MQPTPRAIMSESIAQDHMGQLADLLRDQIAELKRQDDEHLERLKQLLKVTDELIAENNKLIEALDE